MSIDEDQTIMVFILQATPNSHEPSGQGHCLAMALYRAFLIRSGEMPGGRVGFCLRILVCPVDCRQDPFRQRLVEYAMTSSDIQHDFIVTAETLAPGKLE